MFPQHLLPFTLDAQSAVGDYLLLPSRKMQFNDISGAEVDMSASLPRHYLHKIAIQSDNRRSISRNWHRDTDILTVNIYSEGDPLRYRIGEHIIHIKAPAVFMHRGVKHPFGLDAAVEHQGRDQKGARANLAYEFDLGEPFLGMDVINY